VKPKLVILTPALDIVERSDDDGITSAFYLYVLDVSKQNLALLIPRKVLDI